VINGSPFDRDKFRTRERGVTAEQLYVNQKITDLVSKAEMEQSDYCNDWPPTSAQCLLRPGGIYLELS
jgi:hypothetical protein